MKKPINKNETVSLRELEIDDDFIVFSHAMTGKADTFRVIGKNTFNSRHGSATRICKNLRTGLESSHSGRKKVIVTMQYKKRYDD